MIDETKDNIIGYDGKEVHYPEAKHPGEAHKVYDPVLHQWRTIQPRGTVRLHEMVGLRGAQEPKKEEKTAEEAKPDEKKKDAKAATDKKEAKKADKKEDKKEGKKEDKKEEKKEKKAEKKETKEEKKERMAEQAAAEAEEEAEKKAAKKAAKKKAAAKKAAEKKKAAAKKAAHLAKQKRLGEKAAEQALTGMVGGNGAPSQGFRGEIVEHVNGETMTHDWMSEYGPNGSGGSHSWTKICREYPKNAWCKHHLRKAMVKSAAAMPACLLSMVAIAAALL